MAKYDVGTAATGALSGAATGSIFGPVGTAVGGALGGLVGLFGSKKKKKKPKTRSTFDPTQQRLYGEYADALHGRGPLSDIFTFDPQQANLVFDQSVARPAYRSFQENIIPSITGQFRSQNLMDSSYAGDALARRGRDVQESLDALRAQTLYGEQQQARGARQDALQNILGMSTFATERPQEKRGVLDQILGTVGPAAGDWLANYLSSRRETPAPSPTSGFAAMGARAAL